MFGIVCLFLEFYVFWQAQIHDLSRQSVTPSPLGAPEEMGVSQGLGRSRGKGWNFVGVARKAEEA